MDDIKIEQLIQRFDRIDDMLRHIHGHIERLEAYGFINRESFDYMLRLIVDNLQDVLDKNIGEEELGKMFYDFQSKCSKITENSYTPVDAKDKEEHEKIVYEREKSRKE